MRDRGLAADPVVCLELMDVWSRSGDAERPYWEQAVHFATGDTTPQDIRVSRPALRSSYDHLLASTRASRAPQLLHRHSSCLPCLSLGPLYSTQIYNAAMLACLRARSFDSVLHLWHTLQHRGLEARETTCSYVIRACLHSGRWQEALKVVQGLKDRWGTQTAPHTCTRASPPVKGGSLGVMKWLRVVMKAQLCLLIFDGACRPGCLGCGCWCCSKDRLLLLRRRPKSAPSRVELVKEVFLVGLTTLAREGEWAALLDLMHDLRQIQVRALPTHQPRCRSHGCTDLAR